MYLRKINFVLVALILIVQIPAQVRKYSNEFLNIGSGARGMAMGNAVVASVDDATAGYWNPSRLSFLNKNPELALMHADYFSGIAKYDFAALALPTANKKRTLGISFVRFGIDDIPNTFYLIEKDGTINYANVTNFSAADYAGIISFGQKLGKLNNWNIGANTKVVHRQLGKFAKSWGFGLDASVSYQNNKGGYFSLMAKDITTTFNSWTFSFNEREKEILFLTNNEIASKSYEVTIPSLTIALAKRLPLGKKSSLLAETNLVTTFDGKRNTLLATDAGSIDPRFGLEFNVNNSFFIRGGIGNFQKVLEDNSNTKKVLIYQPSGGAGFKFGNIKLDYAFTNLSNQSNPLYTHVFSLGISLVKKPKNQNSNTTSTNTSKKNKVSIEEKDSSKQKKQLKNKNTKSGKTKT